MHQANFQKAHFAINEGPSLILAGALHYNLLPHQDSWQFVLEQMRSGGFNTVVVPFPWSYHCPGVDFTDFTGPRNIQKLLDLVEKHGLWLIAHIGPWTHSYLSAGGIPEWLLSPSGDLEATTENNRCNHHHEISSDFYRALRFWWERILPLFIDRPNLLFTMLHPGKLWNNSTSHISATQLLKLAKEYGNVSRFAFPEHDSSLSTIGASLPVSIWKLSSEEKAEPSSQTLGLNANFVFVHLIPENNRTREKQLDHNVHYDVFELLSLINKLMAHGFRDICIDPVHKGCHWGNFGLSDFHTLYKVNAPIDTDYIEFKMYLATRRNLMTFDIFNDVLYSPDTDVPFYASDEYYLVNSIATSKGSLAFFENPNQSADSVNLSIPSGDEMLTVEKIPLPARSSFVLPLDLPVAGGSIKKTSMQFVFKQELAGRTLCVFRNEGGGLIQVSGAFRLHHVKGDVITERTRDGYLFQIGHGRLHSIVLDAPESKLQLLILDSFYAERLWPLDDTWRTSKTYQFNTVDVKEEPTHGILIGPDLVVTPTETEGRYRYLVSGKGFGYRWGPWRGSDPQTWLAPISWPDFSADALPRLEWEVKAGAFEMLPDFSDTKWRVAPTLDRLEDYQVGFLWYRGRYDEFADELLLESDNDCDIFLNATLIATLKSPHHINNEGIKVIPLPKRYQDKSNILSILIESGRKNTTISANRKKRGLLSCELNTRAPIQWRYREGLIGQRRFQGFSGYADWTMIPAGGQDYITWYQSKFRLCIPADILLGVFFEIDSASSHIYIYLNSVLIGRTSGRSATQNRFWLPTGLLKIDGENEILVAQWTRGAKPGLGSCRLIAGPVRKWYDV